VSKRNAKKVVSVEEALEKAAQVTEFVRIVPWALKRCIQDTCYVRLCNRDVNAAINNLLCIGL